MCVCVGVCVLYRRPHRWTYRAQIWHGGPHLPQGGYKIHLFPNTYPPGKFTPLSFTQKMTHLNSPFSCSCLSKFFGPMQIWVVADPEKEAK